MSWLLRMSWVMVAAVVAMGTSVVQAQPSFEISELYIDAENNGNGIDGNDGFEISGPANDPVRPEGYRVFFVVLENEQSGTNDPGEVDFVFELDANEDDFEFNGDGVYWVACEDETLNGTPDETYDPDDGSPNVEEDEGRHLENSGGTCFLIAVDVSGGTPTLPTVGQDWDGDGGTEDDGILDSVVTQGQYTIMDSIGLVGEQDDVCAGDGAILYSENVNFAAGAPGLAANITAPTAVVSTDFEVDDCYDNINNIQYAGRCGTTGEWHVAERDESGGVLVVSTTGGGTPRSLKEDGGTVGIVSGTMSSFGSANLSCDDDDCFCEVQ